MAGDRRTRISLTTFLREKRKEEHLNTLRRAVNTIQRIIALMSCSDRGYDSATRASAARLSTLKRVAKTGGKFPMSAI
jgi:hypothetical protein